jgi:ferritin-like protein 2
LRHQAQNTVTQMMRMYEYIKQSSATPVLQNNTPGAVNFRWNLFEQTMAITRSALMR